MKLQGDGAALGRYDFPAPQNAASGVAMGQAESRAVIIRAIRQATLAGACRALARRLPEAREAMLAHAETHHMKATALLSLVSRGGQPGSNPTDRHTAEERAERGRLPRR